MSWALLGGSLAGVLALAGLAAWLGLGRKEPLTEAEVMEWAEFELAPFATQAAFVGADGLAALVLGEDGRVLGLKKHGTQPASRLLPLPLHWRTEEGTMVFATGDRMFGDLRLPVDAETRDRLEALL